MPELRVVHVLPSFSPGGAERMAVHLLRGLAAIGVQVAAVSLFGPQGTDLEAMLADSEIPVTYLGKHRGFDSGVVRSMIRVVGHVRPNVIHTHQYALRYALPSILRHRIPAKVHTVHSVAEREVNTLGQLIHRVAYACGVVPVAIASEVANSVQRVYKRAPQLIFNGIPLEQYVRSDLVRERWRSENGFSTDEVLLVCVARLTPPKRQDQLIRAFAASPGAREGAKLLLVGAGAECERLKAIARDLEVESTVCFLGLRADIPAILNAGDAFVLTSDWEGNPLSILEAMAVGKPVIASAVGGIPELVEHGVTGFLVPPGDTGMLETAITTLVGSPELRRSMATQGAERAARSFDAKLMAARYAQLYRELLTGRRGRRL